MDKFDELTKYKQLLDQKIITQDEFDEVKRSLLKKNAIHEHLNTGARIASSSFDSLKKKTGNTYEVIKEKGSQWIEKELEKEQENENRKKALREKHNQTKQVSDEPVNRDKAYKLTHAKQYVKRILFIIMIMALIMIVVLVALFLLREKISFSSDNTYTIHGLEYSVAKDYKKKKGQSGEYDSTEINAEKDDFEIYSKSNAVIATYSIEYLGEDINLDKYKERMSRALVRRTITQSDNLITIDGYYKKNKLSIQNVTNNGLVKQRVLLFVKDYSCFMVVFKCNAWNYNKEACDRLLDSVKIMQYKNRNIAKALNITYKGSYKNGYEPTAEDFKVEVQYKSGKRSVAEAFKLQAPKQLSERDNEVVIECHGIKKRLHLRPAEEKNTIDNETQKDSLEKDTLPFGEDGQQT